MDKGECVRRNDQAGAWLASKFGDAAKWDGVPVPADAMLILPGLALA
jgi:hypothetical protein